MYKTYLTLLNVIILYFCVLSLFAVYCVTDNHIIIDADSTHRDTNFALSPLLVKTNLISNQTLSNDTELNCGFCGHNSRALLKRSGINEVGTCCKDTKCKNASASLCLVC